MEIRRYRPEDRADLVDICLRTGDAGQDATDRYHYAGLLADVYAVPYTVHDPDLAFVVDNGQRVVGYVLATADTRAFDEWFVSEWWPGVSSRYDPAGLEKHERRLIDEAARPGRMLVPEAAEYPAHLHIDLLPEAQGQGLGRELIERLFDELRGRGVIGLHLTTDPKNVTSHHFYTRVGLDFLPSHRAEAPILGIRF